MHLSGSWGSVVKASCGVRDVLQPPARARLRVRGLSSVRGQHRQTHKGDTNPALCATGQRSYCASATPGPASPPPTTAMLSCKEQNFGTSLNGIGFPAAQRVPKRHFQRSLSVVIAPEGSSCGIQILLESRPFDVEEWLKWAFGLT